MTVSNKGKIITFYSYKGGTGRSMALANIAWILASNSKRVLVVDWDLEAPGLQRYFRPFLVDRELTSSPGVVDLITDFILEAVTPLNEGEKLEPDWFLPRTDIDPYVISLNWKFPTGGQLDFIPAGRQGPDYGQRFAAINWQKFYDVLGGGAFIEQLKINMRSQYDYILVDSRTGVSDTSGICTIQMPDTLVVCFTLNNQSIEGAASITQGVAEQRVFQDSHLSLTQRDRPESSSATVPDQFYVSPFRFKIFPVPMRVDQAEQDKLGVRRAYSRRKFDPFLDRMTVIDRKAFWGAVSVPYVPYFSYEEVLAPFKDDPSDPNTCLAAFVRITAEITEKDVTEFIPLISPEKRDAILQDFASVPIPELVGSTGAADNGKVIAGRGGSVGSATTMAGTGSAEHTETELESSLRRAEGTFRSLNDQEREQARLLWMRLVRIPRPGELTENTKVRVPLKDIGAESTPVIQRFAAAEVLTVSRDDKGEPTVEVKNEELLRSWPTLDRWINGDRYLMLWRQDLGASIAQWDERGRKTVDLLTGRRLWKSREWYKSHRRYLNADEVNYIETSLRWFTAVSLVAVAIIVVMLVGIYLQQKRSDKTRVAESIAGDAESQIVSATRGQQLSAEQFELGLLLATEAQQLAPTTKSETLLRTNLGRLPRRLSSIDMKNNVLSLRLSPSGTQVLSVTGTLTGFPGQSQTQEDWVATLNDLSNGQVILRVPFQGSRDFVLSSDAAYLAVVVSTKGDASVVNVVEAATGKTVVSIPHETPILYMDFSPDGSYFATASSENGSRLVNLKGSTRIPFQLPFRDLTGVKFSGDSRHVAFTGKDAMVHVLRNFPGATQFSDSRQLKVGGDLDFAEVAFSYDGRYLAMAGFRGDNIEVWDVETERVIKRYSGTLWSLSFTPDSKFLLATALNNVRVLGLLAGDSDNRIQYEATNGLIFSNDGKYFAAYGDKAARIWEYDGSSLKEIATLLHKSKVQRLSFGNPGFVVTAAVDNFITVWKLGEPVSDNLRYEACSRLTRNLTIDEWNAYVASSLGAYRRTCSEIP